MLAIEGENRSESLALALGGARLYAWLQIQHPPQPPWVAVLEEQFCRYALLWLKEQGLTEVQRAQQALPLVERLLALHPDRPAWIESLQRECLAAAGSPAPTPAHAPAADEPSWIPRGFLDPRLDFPAPPAEPTPALAWHEPLHTYPLGQLPVADGLVLPVGAIANGYWWCDCVQYLPEGWPSAPWLQNLAGYTLHRPSPERETLGLLPPPGPPEEEVLSGSWAVLNDIVGHRNLAHFLADTVPQLVALRQLRQEHPDLQVLAAQERYPNLAHLRRLLLPGEVRFRDTLPPRPLRVETLWLQSVAFNGGSGFHPHHQRAWYLALPQFRQGLALLREALALPEPAAVFRHHWVCFCRDLAAPTEAPQGRYFSNYPQLLEQLSNHGVLLLDPGRHHIQALQSLMQQARGFVGIHGAGLANAFLAPEGCRVIEIRPHGGAWEMLELLGRAAGLDWRVSTARTDPADPLRSVIEVAEVLQLME